MAAGRLDVFVKDFERQAGTLHGSGRSAELCGGADKEAKLMRQHAGLGVLGQPIGDCFGFVRLGRQYKNRRRWTVENGNGVATVLAVAVNVSDFRAEQSVGLSADLVRRAVVDP